MRRSVLLLVALAACGPGRWWESKHVVGPDGTRDWVVARCRFRADCLAGLGKSCPSGYDVTRDEPAPKDTTMMAHCRTPTRTAPPATGAISREFPE